MVRDILRLDLAINSISKPSNRVEKIPNLVAMNCLCLLISPCELILVLLAVNFHNMIYVD